MTPQTVLGRFPRHFMPRRIATQIIGLVVMSAVIFHLCMSGAFLLNRVRWSHSASPEAAHRLDHDLGLLGAADPNDRDALLRAMGRADPDLGLGLAPAAPGHQAFTLPDGTAVSADADVALRHRPDPSVLAFGTLVFVAASTTLFAVWAVRSVTAPLGRLAAAVDAFALDGGALPLAEDGSAEIATVSRGFNRMRARIAGMMRERTEMLAAVGHDLRTPITRLRLRAEFVADASLRDLMLRDLRQMDALVQSALSFIRDHAVARKTARLDLASLLRTVCDEAADLGGRVRYSGPDHLVVEGHEDELRRAVGNLIDNAARLDAETVVELARRPDGTTDITVSDDGPGIPSDRIADMLQPFRRGAEDGARAATPGFGLGLPIVQAIASAHGGRLDLSNREPHGLRCRIALPAA